jgi:DNA-binding MarR family transcriptional regulator
LQHHSVVELVDRSVRERLLARGEDSEDARRVILTVTKKGRRVLDELSADHACELREMGPRLVRALDGIGSIEDATERPAREGQRKRSVKTPKGGRRRGP